MDDGNTSHSPYGDEDTLLDQSDDYLADGIIEHWRTCESDTCPLCPHDNPNDYDHARQLARFAHEDSAVAQCP